MLNQYGSRDFWAAVVDWGVPDVRRSGRRGFESAGAYITQQRHPKFGHGDYFYDLNYEGNWLPFLQGLELRSRSGRCKFSQELAFSDYREHFAAPSAIIRRVCLGALG